MLSIITIPNPKAPGYPRASAGASAVADATPLDRALELEWPTDRHFQAIAPWEAGGAVRRVNVAQLSDEQLAVAPVRLVLRVFDVDTPGHAPRTDEWTRDFVARVEALPHAKPVYYFTSAGARLVWRLPGAGFLIDSREAYARWVREAECCIRTLREKYGLEADPACKDPSRLFRLPNVERPEKGTQRSRAFGDLEAAVWDYPYFKKYENETPVEGLARRAVAASADAPASASQLALAFGEDVRVLGPEKVAVRCPWTERHSDHGRRDPLAGGTVVFATSDGEGFFWCSHAHCAERRQVEVYEALGAEAPWRARLSLTDRGAVKQTSENVVTCLEGTGGPPWWAWNARAERWENPRGRAPDAPRGMAAEAMAGELTRWVHDQLGFDPSTRVLKETVLPWLAARRGYNPLTEWLDQCYSGWDRRERSLADYCQLAEGTHDWARLALGTWLRSAVARAYAPGCQADLVLVLQGPQGVRKSSLCRLLAGRGAYALELAHAANDRDTLATLHRGAWVVELAEGVALSKADAKELKALTTRPTDVFRRAYGAGEEERPRGFVFAVTTNESEFLADPTGLRRWAVVELAGRIDTDGVDRDLEHLLGQAVAEFRSGAAWHFDSDQEAVAAEHASAYAVTDVLTENVIEWTNELGGATLDGYLRKGVAMREILPLFEKHCRSGRPGNELGGALRKAGWRKTSKIQGVYYWKPLSRSGG